jgi:PBSX family phage terminase large subunit
MSIQMTYSTKQKKVLREANHRWNILSGAVRSGKTFSSYDLLILRLAEFPTGNRLLIGKTERTLERNVLDPMRERFQEVSTINHKGIVEIFGKPFYCVGANDEKSVKKIQGLGLSYAYGDEITTWPESFFNMLKSRLDKPGAKFDGTCNPESPRHWFKLKFLDKTDLDIFHQHFELDDNPFLSEEFKNNLKKEYTGVWYKRFIQGLWVLAQGIIYDCFDEKIHIVDKLPEGQYRYYLGGDYGTSNPTAFLLLAHNLTTNILYLIDEYYYDSKVARRQKTDSEYANDLKKFIKGRYPQAIYLDPSAASFSLEAKRAGINGIRPADNSVLDGIRTVASLYSQGRLFVLKGKCPNYLLEVASYVWDEKAQEYGEDKPIKQSDHTQDALRYVCFSQFKKLITQGVKKPKGY